MAQHTGRAQAELEVAVNDWMVLQVQGKNSCGLCPAVIFWLSTAGAGVVCGGGGKRGKLAVLPAMRQELLECPAQLLGTSLCLCPRGLGVTLWQPPAAWTVPSH